MRAHAADLHLLADILALDPAHQPRFELEVTMRPPPAGTFDLRLTAAGRVDVHAPTFLQWLGCDVPWDDVDQDWAPLEVLCGVIRRHPDAAVRETLSAAREAWLDGHCYRAALRIVEYELELIHNDDWAAAALHKKCPTFGQQLARLIQTSATLVPEKEKESVACR